jgi:hypothetical protein
MRIYNGKNSTINVPLPNGERLSIDGKSISKDFMPSVEFLNIIKASFDYSEIALVVSGIIEMNLCSSVSSIAGFVANSVGEAVERFADKPKVTEKEAPAPVVNPELITEENEKKKEEEVKEQEKVQEKRKKSKA